MKIGNIKIRRKYKINDVKIGIAKVFPSLINLEVNPTKEKQVFNHENSYGYDEVVVNPVTNEVDENIKPNNIKAGVNILGVEGNIENIDYWISEAPSQLGFDLLAYVKEVPKNIDTSTATELPLRTCKNLEKADLSKWDLTKITFISFLDCKKLKELVIDNCNTDNLTSMSSICNNCGELEKVILNINTSKVTNMNSCFYKDSKIEELDLSNLESTNVTNMYNMFNGCSKLKKLDIRNFTFDKVTSYSNMFYNVPADCLIIVKDDIAKNWVLARRSDFTNVKTVAELEG